MARYNEILVGRYARAVQKNFGMKGEVPVGSLAGEMQVVVPMFWGVEARYLESWETYGINFQVAGVAANTSCVRLRNPVTSNVICILLRVAFSFDTAQTVAVHSGKANLDLATVAGLGNTNLDLRTRIAPSLVLSRQNTTPAAPPLDVTDSILDSLNVSVNTPRELITFEEQEIPLLPGGALQIQGGAVNLNLATSWIWRERALEESERS